MTMIKKITEVLLKISSTWVMIISLLVMVGFMIFVLPAQAAGAASESGSERSPDTSFIYTPDDLYQMAEEYGESGRRAYIRARWTFDLIFPLVYTAFLTFGIGWFVQRLSGWGEAWKLTALLPLLGGAFDLLENSATSLAMAAYPSSPGWILIAASIFTPIKWIFVSVSFIPYIIFVLAWLIQKIQGKGS